MVLGWKRPGRVGRRRIPLGAVATCCRAFSHRNRVEKRLDFFLCSKQYFLPISPQIVPDSGAICLRCATACACCRERQCRLTLAAAPFTSKSSREATRFLSLFEAILSSHLPENCTGQRRDLLTVCHRLRLLPRAAVPSVICCRAFSHRNRVEKRLDFFLCSKRNSVPIIPQIAPDSGAICFVCVCLRHIIELV